MTYVDRHPAGRNITQGTGAQISADRIVPVIQTTPHRDVMRRISPEAVNLVMGDRHIDEGVATLARARELPLEEIVESARVLAATGEPVGPLLTAIQSHDNRLRERKVSIDQPRSRRGDAHFDEFNPEISQATGVVLAYMGQIATSAGLLSEASDPIGLKMEMAKAEIARGMDPSQTLRSVEGDIDFTGVPSKTGLQQVLPARAGDYTALAEIWGSAGDNKNALRLLIKADVAVLDIPESYPERDQLLTVIARAHMKYSPLIATQYAIAGIKDPALVRKLREEFIQTRFERGEQEEAIEEARKAGGSLAGKLILLREAAVARETQKFDVRSVQEAVNAAGEQHASREVPDLDFVTVLSLAAEVMAAGSRDVGAENYFKLAMGLATTTRDPQEQVEMFLAIAKSADHAGFDTTLPLQNAIQAARKLPSREAFPLWKKLIIGSADRGYFDAARGALQAYREAGGLMEPGNHNASLLITLGALEKRAARRDMGADEMTESDRVGAQIRADAAASEFSK